MSFLSTAWRATKATAVPVGKTAMGGALGRMALGGAIGAGYGALTNQYNDPEMAMGRIARLALYGGLAGGASRLFTPSIRFNKAALHPEAGLIGPRLPSGDFFSSYVGPRMSGGRFFSTKPKITTSGMPSGIRAMKAVGSHFFSEAINRPGLRAVTSAKRPLIGPRLASGAFTTLGPITLKEYQARSYAHAFGQGLIGQSIAKGGTLLGMSLNYPMLTAGVIGGAYALNQTNKTPYDSHLANSVVNQPVSDVSRGVTNMKMAREAQMVSQMDNSVAPTGIVGGGTSIRNQRLLESTMGLVQGIHRSRHG